MCRIDISLFSLCRFFRISKSAPLLFSFLPKKSNKSNSTMKYYYTYTQSVTIYFFLFFYCVDTENEGKFIFFLTLFLYNTKNWNKSFFLVGIFPQSYKCLISHTVCSHEILFLIQTVQALIYKLFFFFWAKRFVFLAFLR